MPTTYINSRPTSHHITQLGFGDPRIYKGSYINGGGFLSDAFRYLLPIITGYSTRKLTDFGDNFAGQLKEGQSIKEAFKKSAKTTGQKVLKDLTGKGKKRKRATSSKVSKKRTKRDFFDLD